jgi:hypothetical protein
MLSRALPIPGARMMERYPMTATTLGLPAFPGNTLGGAEANGHIMGVVVLAWLTQHPVRRWGDDWAEWGTMRLRYREHLWAGTPVTVMVSDATRLGLEVVDGEGRLCADGTAALASSACSYDLSPQVPPASPPAGPVAPFPDTVSSLVLRPLEFDFIAERDLAFVDDLPDGDWWRSRGWAHPAWVASGANAVLANSIAFDDGGYWRHSGSEMRQLRPIGSGARLLLKGRVEELFQGRHHRFGVAAISVFANGVPAAALRVTFVYGAASPTLGLR